MAGSRVSAVADFGLGGRDVPDRLEEPSVVEPVDPFEGATLDGLEAASRASAADHLGLEGPDDALGECVVVGVVES